MSRFLPPFRIDDELAGTIPPCTHLYLFKSPSLSAIYLPKVTTASINHRLTTVGFEISLFGL